MKWLKRRQPRDLIADATAEWETQRAEEQVAHDAFTAELINTITRGLRGDYSARVVEPLIAAGGWCAPSDVNYDLLDFPSIQVSRGGIR